MKILIIASDKGGKFAPFIEEQMAALEARGIEVMRYGITGKGIFGYLRERPALRRLIRAEHPDIIHAHYGLSGLLANLQRLVPVVTTYHGSDINAPSILRLSKIAMRLSAHNIFVSVRSASIALGLCATSSDLKDFKDLNDLKEGATEKNTLLPCGVNLTDDQLQSRAEARKALGIAEHEQIVLFAGAFANAVKDAPLAQEAVTMIAPNFKDFKDLKDLNEGAPRLQELRGFSRAEVNQWMCAANCLLMTSKTEGSPQVVKEAMACGCPIVSVDVGDVAERLSGVEGCFVVPTREPKDIAEALQKALAFEGKTNGRERIIAMGLSNEQVAKRLESIYKHLIG
ncbi:MAG: glycosyltransferase family 4 protein [Paludibacteraceae bacterium]|nr:glycosyltransferase family 4 protein [Paludibacteraceae bacterium]